MEDNLKEQLKYEVRSNLTFNAISNGNMNAPTNSLQISEMTDFIVNGDLRDTATVRVGKYISRIMQWNDIAKVDKNEDNVNLYAKLIAEEYNEFLDAFGEKDDVEQADACIDMVWVIIGFMRAKGWTPYTVDKLFAEVDRSNFSKFIENESGELECIKRTDGKIIKPEHFSKPDIPPILKAN